MDFCVVFLTDTSSDPAVQVAFPVGVLHLAAAAEVEVPRRLEVAVAALEGAEGVEARHLLSLFVRSRCQSSVSTINKKQGYSSYIYLETKPGSEALIG